MAEINRGTMKLLSDWGFSWAGLRQGDRGEYWVMAQALLFFGFLLLPVWSIKVPTFIGLYGVLPAAVLLLLNAIFFFFRGFIDLGHSLTPLPYPREDGELVQTGVYSIVRHPIYSGVILGGLGWALFQLSLSHVVGAIAFLVFFDAKANREEAWLTEKYPGYAEYQQKVKKLIPGIY
jgi:protein-S-isoprenylcysteine O-methyltransferase Ste14